MIRKSKRLTIRDMALKMGISPSYYCHLENGHRRFSEQLITKCSEALGEDVRDLVKYGSASWIPYVKVNDKCIITAFSDEIKIESAEGREKILKRFINFAEENIGEAINKELSTNKKLADSIVDNYTINY